MNWYDIKEIKEKSKILEIASTMGIRVSGKRIRCHNDQCRQKASEQPSVNINAKRNTFECFICHEWGDVIDFVCKYKKLQKRDAIKYLADKAGIKPLSTNKDIIKKQKVEEFRKVIEVNQYLLELCQDIPPKCEKWLEDRGISIPTAQKLRLGFISDYNAVADSLKKKFSTETLKLSGLFNNDDNLIFYVHRLIVPYLKNDEPVYIQAKSIDGRYVPQELFAIRPILYPFNVECLKATNRIFICKGIMDTLTLISQGLDAVGIPEKVNFKRRWLSLFKDRIVTIVFKGGHENRQKANKLARFLNDNEAKASVIDLPSGIDVNSFFLIHKRFFNQKRF